MVDVRERTSSLIEDIRRERDELRVKLHLAKLEASEEWQELEHKWERLEAKSKAIGAATAESSKEIAAAAKILGNEIRDGFKRIGRQL